LTQDPIITENLLDKIPMSFCYTTYSRYMLNFSVYSHILVILWCAEIRK